MICPTCGVANEDGVLFCEKCKTDLEMPAAQSSQGPSRMNDSMSSSTLTEEPIPLAPVNQEPIPLDPVAPVTLESVVAVQASASPTDAPDKRDSTTEPTVEQPALPPASEPAPTLNPRLEVLRGQRMEVKYPIYPGKNYLGRTDEKPVDIDLDDQEAPDRIWCSRQHAVINFDDGRLTIEDLNSLNGTFVNRTRVHPGQTRELRDNDVIQVGTVHMKVVTGA